MDTVERRQVFRLAPDSLYIIGNVKKTRETSASSFFLVPTTYIPPLVWTNEPRVHFCGMVGNLSLYAVYLCPCIPGFRARPHIHSRNKNDGLPSLNVLINLIPLYPLSTTPLLITLMSSYRLRHQFIKLVVRYFFLLRMYVYRVECTAFSGLKLGFDWWQAIIYYQVATLYRVCQTMFLL